MNARKSDWATVLAAILGFFALNAAATTLYVDVNCTNAAPPYTNWATAATVIQDAINAASSGDIILVTNGIYQQGGRPISGAMTNRVAVTKPLTLQSVNGPAATVIRGTPLVGNTAVRCVYLTNGAVLTGFTVADGATRTSGDLFSEQCGGGVWCESVSCLISNSVLVGNSAYNWGGGAWLGTFKNCSIVTNSAWTGAGMYGSYGMNCLLSGNSAKAYGGGANGARLASCSIVGNSADFGGGVDGGFLTNCLVVSNQAWSSGGGVECASGPYLQLYNCTVVENSAFQGRGASSGKLLNCIVYFNSAPHDPNAFACDSAYSCTMPLPAGGTGNFTNPPLFFDLAAGNFRLQSNSPCINAGNNAYVATTTDLDGNPRIMTASPTGKSGVPVPSPTTRPPCSSCPAPRPTSRASP